MTIAIKVVMPRGITTLMANDALNPKKLPIDRWEAFVRKFREHLLTPSIEYPNVRYWTRANLISVISAVKLQHRGELRSTFPIAAKVIEHLESIGWIREVAIAPSKSDSLRIYLIDMEAQPDQPASPFELLQATVPTGVISYFGAISFHGLTTQVPKFFHIGRIRKTEPAFRSTESALVPMHQRGPHEQRSRNPLGIELFRHEDAVFYETNRFAAFTPGIQTRILGPRAQLRITTVEQCLLDTLMQPERCGGEAVVFESWDNSVRSADMERLGAYLEAINRDELWRRCGAMLDLQGVKPTGDKLTEGLRRTHASIRAAGTSIEIPLLPGLGFNKRNADWCVSTP